MLFILPEMLKGARVVRPQAKAPSELTQTNARPKPRSSRDLQAAQGKNP
jgi:hypothetical protein